MLLLRVLFVYCLNAVLIGLLVAHFGGWLGISKCTDASGTELFLGLTVVSCLFASFNAS